ncbi:MAG: hypothetical protein OXE78_03370 [Gammaproteobacteria bacterium]|nr:hypothetical protein [Gammaproteobacteria bacterium]
MTQGSELNLDKMSWMADCLGSPESKHDLQQAQSLAGTGKQITGEFLAHHELFVSKSQKELVKAMSTEK